MFTTDLPSFQTDFVWTFFLTFEPHLEALSLFEHFIDYLSSFRSVNLAIIASNLHEHKPA